MKRLVLALVFAFATTCIASAQEPPFGVTAGFSYLASKEGAPGHADVRGGYIQPAVNLGYGLAAYGNLGLHHGEDQYGDFSLTTITGGLSKRIVGTPFGATALFGELGNTRVSYHDRTGVTFGSNKVQNGLTFMTGVEFAVPLSPNVALSMTPVGLAIRGHGVDPFTSSNVDGQTRVGYFARVGVSFYFGGHGPHYRRY